MHDKTLAGRLQAGDPTLATELAAGLIRPFNNNLVPRPWGGARMLAYKGLDAPPAAIAEAGQPAGEAFELAAFDEDPEAARFPSVVGLADGSTVTLPELLRANANEILGAEFVERYGAQLPLLPKTLDVAELLSVQGHPPGNTELYIVIDADPGATIRLGFSADVEAEAFAKALHAGRTQQSYLIELFGRRALEDVQRVLGPWLAARGAPPDSVAAALTPLLESESDWPAARALLESIKQLYWRVLDSLNAVPVSAGQVIYNATPERLCGEAAASAEVHALGNPEGKSVLALEIRKPGPTFRAWDHVRFPVRDVDIDVALEALNLKATAPDEFVVFPELVPGRPGVYCSVDSSAFRVEHLRPTVDGGPIVVAAEPSHCLHAIGGRARFEREDGTDLGALKRGESALVPIGVKGYRVFALAEETEVVKVSLPV